MECGTKIWECRAHHALHHETSQCLSQTAIARYLIYRAQTAIARYLIYPSHSVRHQNLDSNPMESKMVSKSDVPGRPRRCYLQSNGRRSVWVQMVRYYKVNNS